MFGRLILKYRRLLSLTQEELADQSGLSVRTVRRLEAGQSQMPRAASVRRLAAAFQLHGAERESFLQSASGVRANPALMPSGAGELFSVPTFASAVRVAPGALVPPLLAPVTNNIERGGEEARLLAAVDRYRQGRPQVASLEGLADEGKTALAIGVARRVVSGFPSSHFWQYLDGHGHQSQLSDGLARRTEALSELLELRKVLETALIDDAIRALTPQSREALKLVLAQAKERAERGKTFPDQERNFHRLLFADLGNEMLLWLFDLFWVAFDQASPPSNDQKPMDDYQCYACIARAVVSGDSGRARTAVRDYYRSIERRIKARQGDVGDAHARAH
jgi:transcriptional regulator with XRE-family HTH domain